MQPVKTFPANRTPPTAAVLAILLAVLAAAAQGESPPPDVTTRPVKPVAQHPLDPALRIARDGLEYIQENVSDYSAVIVKRERVKGKLSDHQYMFAKIRNRKASGERVEVPLAVYLKFLKPKSIAGREVIWVEGKNDGKLIAHEGGFKNLIRAKLPPDGFVAMMGQRYPITKIGFENLVAELIQKGERDRQWGECVVKFYKNTKVDTNFAKRVCTMIEVTHPVRRPHFEFYRARIYIDDELNVPIRYAAWEWPESANGEPVLLEEYTYANLQLNVGLTQKDFDPDNPQYNFP